MPNYDYNCSRCGAFTCTRSMAESSAPQPCPGCGAAAPRALLRAPALGGVSATSAAAGDGRTPAAHRTGCACCAGPRTPFGAPVPRTGIAPAH